MIGHPYIVTGADGALITELGGRPPLQRLREIIDRLPRDEQKLVSRGLQIGIVVDEHLAAPGQGEPLCQFRHKADSAATLRRQAGAAAITDALLVAPCRR
jgi:small ligand-binding sensory domain FIST